MATSSTPKVSDADTGAVANVRPMQIDGFEGDDDIRQTKESVLANGWGPYLKSSMSEVFFGSKLNVFMLLTPFALLGPALGFGDGITFTLALLAIAPFAERLGFVTEQLAIHTNDTIGGLLNATFGNATELIICIFALEDGLLRVVQVSLLGSVLSNMLLVLGCAFLVGGYRHKTQHFNKSAASTNVGMLMLAVMSLSFPAALEASGQAQMAGTTSAEKLGHELELSRWISLVLFTTYGAYLLFQLKTHQYLFEGEDDDEDEEDFLGYWGAIAWLTILTIFIALLSEVLVDAITGAAVDWGVSTIFIGAIIIPIIGNAAEHASAVLFAYRNKMDISLGVAIGSSTQISVCVIPLCVLIAWFMDQPLTLYFKGYETMTIFSSVIAVAFLIQTGESNWLMGWMLIAAYLIVAIGFWEHVDEPDLSH